MREELITRNVALLVDMPEVSKDRGTAWNAREAIAFLRSVRAHRLYAACVLVLVLGLRRSEVLGLRRQDIDFEAGRFTPVKQVQRVKGVGPGPQGPQEGVLTGRAPAPRGLRPGPG
ncbi:MULTISPECIES: hypothetical protein [Streptomyces]|uniref:hypothetical protein n=1 Tax=Streptomyces TaxID=1883 RepID=UPI0029B50053|nr:MULTISPECIES: hypothetical protein [unclassified Streptomyces]MDX3087377.1 hypothetical protein [Streptomyces sp. ME12-02E]MDX3332809.1 hypothetical protein [Streptomyces sp. ME02-6978a]